MRPCNRISELWPDLGDGDLRRAAYRGGCRACQDLRSGAIRLVWLPPVMQEVSTYEHGIERGLVSGLFSRPSRAAGRYGDLRNGSKTMKRARALWRIAWFYRPDLFDLLPIRVFGFSHPPHRRQAALRCMMLMQQRPAPDPGTPRSLSAWPRRRGPSCSPGRWRRASAACAPRCARARNPRGSSGAPASSVATSLR